MLNPPLPSVMERLFGDDIHPRLSDDGKIVIEYWRDKCGAQDVPFMGDIDLPDLAKQAPHCELVDVSHDPRRRVYRFVGTEEAMLRESDPTGLTVEEGFFCGTVGEVLESYNLVIDRREPMVVVAEVVKKSGYTVMDVGLFLPLAGPGGTVDRVLTYAEQSPLVD